MNSDKFNYFPAETADPIGKYTQPKEYSVDMGGKENVGYPSGVGITPKTIVRGCGACTKGNKFNSSIIK